MLKVAIVPSDEKDFAESKLDITQIMSTRTKLIFEDDEKHRSFLYIQNSDLERWGLEYISANSIMEYSKTLEEYVVTIDDAPYKNDTQRYPHKIIELDFCFDKNGGAENVYKRRDNKRLFIIRQNGDDNWLPCYCTCNVYQDYYEADTPFRANIEIKAFHGAKMLYHEYTTFLSSGVCVAIPVMTHNEYGLYMSERAGKANKGEISWDDYYSSSSYVKISDYDLDRFNLSDEDKKAINAYFHEERRNDEDMIYLKGLSEECEGYEIAAMLGLAVKVCGFRGYYVNDKKLMVMSFAEGDLSLKIYTDKKKYRNRVKSLEKFYEKNDC